MTSADDAWRSTPVPEEFLAPSSPLIATEDVPCCPVCGGPEYAQFAVGFDYELRTCRNPWRFVQCRRCQHVWLNPRPAVAELGVVYPPTYYAYNYESINPIARRAKQWLDQRKMARIVRHCPRPPSSYLDAGCGDGRFLRLMEDRGVRRTALYGLELDRRVVERLRQEGYIGVLCERAEEVSTFPESAIDLVTMFHVIEHVADPRGSRG